MFEFLYISIVEYLVESDEFVGLMMNIYGYGFRVFGMLFRLLDELWEGFDIDLVVWFD